MVRVFAIQFRLIGVPWLLKVELELSPTWVGIAALSAAVPTILLSLPAGSLADRFDNRRLILTASTASSIAFLVLALLVFSGLVEFWMVVVWSLATGSLAALSAPAQQAILPQLIDMRVIASAVALNGMIWNSMRIVGPAAAGLVIAVIGIGQAFFVTTAGYALATLLMFLVRPTPRPQSGRRGGGGIGEGARFIFGNRLFLAIIGLSFFTSVFGGSYQVLLVYFATDILDVGGFGFGLLEGAAGVGAIVGTLAIIKIGAGPNRGRVIIGGAASFGICVALFAASRFMPLSMAALFAAGVASGIYLNVGMTALQIEVPDELRGRVMGIWSMTWFLSSVGGFFAGVAADLIGIVTTVTLGALSVTGFAILLFVLSTELRTLGGRQAVAAARGG